VFSAKGRSWEALIAPTAGNDPVKPGTYHARPAFDKSLNSQNRTNSPASR
jgi:hypothetical protein